MHRKKTWLETRILMSAFAGLLLAISLGAPARADSTANTQIVVNFFNMIFNEHKVAEAFERYAVPGYIQHNPFAADGAAPAIAFLSPYLENNPDFTADIKRVIAADDLVVVHSHTRAKPDDRGRAVIDIFRVEEARVVEHWDAVQEVPEQSMNDNTMF